MNQDLGHNLCAQATCLMWTIQKPGTLQIKANHHSPQLASHLPKRIRQGQHLVPALEAHQSMQEVT